MKRSLLPLLLIGTTLASCRYTSEFRNTPKNAPHAVLRGTSYPESGHAFATHVNGQPTSFWRSGDVFRIPPGETTCRTAFSDAHETVGYRTERFTAVAGREYMVSRKLDPKVESPLDAVPHPTTTNAWIIYDRRDRITIHESVTNGQPLLVADAPKEDYVFGTTTASAAITKYRQGH